jgi:phosphopentomutase
MRSLFLVLDSVGCGHAPDAADYGDEGAHTLGHILERHPDLDLPHLRSLGLNEILALSAGQSVAHPPGAASLGVLRSHTAGKDTTSGHWELAGAPLEQPFAVFAQFPPDLMAKLETACGTSFLGNEAASGTEIIQRLGQPHLETGLPILYTSADSVLQIAAHTDLVSAAALHDLCLRARPIADEYRIGRVISRPFAGANGNFHRVPGRHDYSFPPPRTMLNELTEAGHAVHGIGKISDIFAGSGITSSRPTASNAEGMATIEELWEKQTPGLLFANLVDFDMLYGHRRDLDGYARALVEFDQWLGRFLPLVQPGDWVLITADHGNDPTWPGNDHTREQVPLFLLEPGSPPAILGLLEGFHQAAALTTHRFLLK